jgi:hypothetical protein
MDVSPPGSDARQLTRLLDRRATHGLGNGTRCGLLAVALRQRVVDMLEDCRLDPAALEHGQAVRNRHGTTPERFD